LGGGGIDANYRVIILAKRSYAKIEDFLEIRALWALFWGCIT